ncbi:MAG TPA: hypothetical protein VID48_16820, partial [Solirubrobacteraceae bacterium]
FLISRTLVARVQHEATMTSAAELGIHQLQTSLPTPVCARDVRGPWSLTLNGTPASVIPTCQAIVPDIAKGLATGALTAFAIDGVHDTSAGRNRYLVSGSVVPGAAGVLRGYSFGQTGSSWSVQIGGAQTAALLPKVDSSGSSVLLIPAAIPGSGCGGQCVALFNDAVDPPKFRCSMPSNAAVTTTPASELKGSGSSNFPDYAFFSDSAGAGRLYVYNASAAGSCNQLASVTVGGLAVGAPLVFPGAVSGRSGDQTVSDEIYVLVTSGAGTSLKHFRYSETTECNRDCDNGNGNGTTVTLGLLNTTSLGPAFGGNAVGYASSSTSAVPGTTISLAIAGASGMLTIAQITVSRGPSYAASVGVVGALAGGVARAPYWCHCPGQDLIGVGSTNGSLYVLSNKLVMLWLYDGKADGSPAINSIPMADANGDWYFGADDGYVYDVEIPTAGAKMFKAARFGPGGAIRSSPILGTLADGCLTGPCLYFASTSAGSYFVRLGGTRIFDLQACISTAAGSTTCVGNPHLWARVEVGPISVIGGSGVYVKGWSYYSP